MPNRKKLYVALLFLGVMAIGVIAYGMNANRGKGGYGVYSSSVQKEDCYACGNHPNSPITPHLGEDNLGLINLNTFEGVCFAVNRYEKNQLVDKLAKYETCRGSYGYGGNGTSFDYSFNRNKGYSSASLYFNKKSDLQLEKIGSFLCMDCLTAVMEQYYAKERYWDIALVDFKTGAIRPLVKSVTGITLSDYYVSIHYDNENDRLNIFAVYCPDRYTEYEYAPNLSATDEVIQYCEREGFAFVMNEEVTAFLAGFGRIAEIAYGDGHVIFRNDSMIGDKELTVYKNGEYHIFDRKKPTDTGK